MHRDPTYKERYMLDDNVKIGLTFDDVLLLPAKSDILPGQVDMSASLTNVSRPEWFKMGFAARIYWFR